MQSYDIILAFKKTKLVLNLLMDHFFNLDPIQTLFSFVNCNSNGINNNTDYIRLYCYDPDKSNIPLRNLTLI